MDTSGILPSPDDLNNLPPWARVAYAARSARRVQPFFSREESEASQEALECVDKAILVAEQLAANVDAGSQTWRAAREINELPTVAKSTRAAYAAFAALYSIQAADTSSDYIYNRDEVYGNSVTKCALAAAHCAALAVASASDSAPVRLDPIRLSRSPEDILRIAADPPRDADKFWGFSRALARDFEVLGRSVHDEAWEVETAVPRNFFSLRSEFELDTSTKIIDISSVLDAKLLESFRRNPARLHQLSPRQFEEIIAILFQEFGFEVELTKRTRDGGKDIVAIRHAAAGLKYLVECKHYSPERPVGVGVVRELLGTVTLEKGTKGILATTSRFTGSARTAIDTIPWMLEGRDFDGLVEWLDQYQAFQIAKITR